MITKQIFMENFITKFRKLKKIKSRNSRNGERTISFEISKVSSFSKSVSSPSTTFPLNWFLTQKTAFYHLDIKTMGSSSTLRVFSTSSLIKQYQFFLSSDSSWDMERLLCKSELICSDKIRSHKNPFVAYITNCT